VLEEDVIEDPEQTCNECQRWGQACMWPRKNRQKACLPCAAKHIKCMWDGESVTQHALQRTGTSPSKRCQITTLEMLESEGDDARVQKMSKGYHKERPLWSIVQVEQSGIQEEMERIWESCKRMEDILQDLVDQNKVFLVVMELFTQGEHFLRTQEMGKLEGQKRWRVC